MRYKVIISPGARKDIRALDHQTQRRIVSFLEGRLAASEDPRTLGEALHGPLNVFWKYRVGDWRIVCTIEDGICEVQVVRVQHRREIYR